MNNTDNILDRIVLEFPENKKEIRILYTKSIDFIEVCEDYMYCLNWIQMLKKMKKLTNEKMMKDLEAVSIDLREELLSMIQHKI